MRIFSSIYSFLKALKKAEGCVKYPRTLDGSRDNLEIEMKFLSLFLPGLSWEGLKTSHKMASYFPGSERMKLVCLGTLYVKKSGSV